MEESWKKISALETRPFVRPIPVTLSSSPLLAEKRSQLTVVCLKWGNMYDASYVNKLLNGLRRFDIGETPFMRRFVCFTDDASGLAAGVEARPLFDSGLKGWWPKASLFSSSAGLDGRVMYIDLDR